MYFLLRSCLKMALGRQLLNANCQQKQKMQLQGLRTSSLILNSHKENLNTTQSNDASDTHGKSKESPKITLIHNENITVTALEEARHLAKRRSLHLVKVQDMDSKTQRPVYKLLTSAEMLQNELSELKKTDKSNAASAGDKVEVHKRSEKFLNIGSRIADHDLLSRLKNIKKWLNKQHEVRILIQGSSEQDLNNCEKIFKAIEEALKTPEVVGKIVQKRTKGSVIKFNILPIMSSTKKKPSANEQ